ncbi:MAG: F0F1 ATP synthase subunit delta [Caldisericia bacterium]
MFTWLTSILDSFSNWLIPTVCASEGAVEHAAEMANPSLLGIDLRTFLFVVLNLILLVILLKAFLYKPVVNMLAERKAAATKVLDEAKVVQNQASQKLDEATKEHDEAITEARTIRAEAAKNADAIKEDILGKARVEAKDIIKSAEEEAKGEREMTVLELKKRSKEVVEVLSTKVISNVFDVNTIEYHTDHIIETLSELTACDITDHEITLCDALKSTGKVKKVMVETAVGLSDPQKKKIETFINDFTGSKPSMNFQINENLISGIKMYLDDTIFDSSVARMVSHTISENLR